MPITDNRSYYTSPVPRHSIQYTCVRHWQDIRLSLD